MKAGAQRSQPSRRSDWWRAGWSATPGARRNPSGTRSMLAKSLRSANVPGTLQRLVRCRRTSTAVCRNVGLQVVGLVARLAAFGFFRSCKPSIQSRPPLHSCLFPSLLQSLHGLEVFVQTYTFPTTPVTLLLSSLCKTLITHSFFHRASIAILSR
jgi:hypothetical protein